MTTDTAAVVRAWVLALSVSCLVALWVLVDRAPFPTSTRPTAAPAAASATAADPRVAALARREQALRQRAAVVRRRHALRWATYRRALGQRQALIQAARSRPAAPVFTTSTSSSAPAPAAATTRSS